MNKLNQVKLSMREYQKMNDIKGQCITNVQTYSDILKDTTSWNIKIKSVYVVSFDNDVCFMCSGHLVIDVDGHIIDPSYEIFKLKDTMYFDNFKIAMSHINKKCITKEETITVLKKFTEFKSYAERMNNGEFIIVDKTYYNKQIDFIESHVI